jgi:membrane-bound lytic murein transglycosylase B
MSTFLTLSIKITPTTTKKSKICGEYGTTRHCKSTYRGKMPVKSLYRLVLLALLATSLATPQAVAQEEITAEDQAQFKAWLKDFRRQAKKSGISKPTLDSSLSGISLNPSVIKANNFQPEFSKPIWDYLDGALSQARIDKGKALYAEHTALLDEIAAIYNVPPRYIVAIWGLESSYGALTGGYNALEALATLGFRGRRAQFGRTQLMAALQIVDNGDKPATAMTGSWAGAMGQTQFIPTTYLTYAIDHDQDGSRDIWSNLGDVFASTSNYLRASGWQQDRSWGREVILPEGFDFALADRNSTQPLAEWSKLGVTFTNGNPVPKIDRPAAIIAPAGHSGPAFMIVENFRVVLRYNNSTAYALAVCLLADLLIDGDPVKASWPRHQRPLTRDERTELQRLLTDKGYDTLGIDGILGANSRKALRAYQKDTGAVPDGFATASVLEGLRAAP